jgi:dihydroneopterin aldolase
MTGMEFYGYHGMASEERALGQRFVVDIELFLDLKKAGMEDLPEYTVDYGAVAEEVRVVLEGPPCKLIEAVAEKLAATILERYPVQEVLIRLKKPNAPLPYKFDSMAVEIRRKK